MCVIYARQCFILVHHDATGIQTVFESCVVKDVGVVPLSECPLSPTLNQSCNQNPCDFSLMVTNFTTCDDNCGSPHSYQSVWCVDHLGFSVNAEFCANQSSNALTASGAPLPFTSKLQYGVSLNWPAPVTSGSFYLRSCPAPQCSSPRFVRMISLCLVFVSLKFASFFLTGCSQATFCVLWKCKLPSASHSTLCGHFLYALFTRCKGFTAL